MKRNKIVEVFFFSGFVAGLVIFPIVMASQASQINVYSGWEAAKLGNLIIFLGILTLFCLFVIIMFILDWTGKLK